VRCGDASAGAFGSKNLRGAAHADGRITCRQWRTGERDSSAWRQRVRRILLAPFQIGARVPRQVLPPYLEIKLFSTSFMINKE
jgi:hypothetical protein